MPGQVVRRCNAEDRRKEHHRHEHRREDDGESDLLGLAELASTRLPPWFGWWSDRRHPAWCVGAAAFGASVSFVRELVAALAAVEESHETMVLGGINDA